MLEAIRQTFNDIRDAIIEMGVDVDYCDSPTTYPRKILSISRSGGGNTLLFIPVYKASETKPAKPVTPMSAEDPTTFPEGWSTPDGLTGNIWMSYTLVGDSYVYVPWTEPIQVTTVEEPTAPVITRTFLIYAELPLLTLEPSIPNGGTWNSATNKLVGPITSTLNTGETVTWSTDNLHVDGMYTYLSMGTFSSTGNIIGTWSDPFCINSARNGKDGKNGRNGVDGNSVEFIYKLCADLTEFGNLETPYSDPDVTDYVPEGWTDQPQGIDGETNLIEAVCTRKLNKETNKWSVWSKPTIWSIWGGDGTDGDGVEYIFRIATDAEVLTPETSTDGKYHLISTAWPPIDEQNLIEVALEYDSGINVNELKAAYQEDEFVPGPIAQQYGWNRGWSDDPLDVASTQPYEFCSIRKEKDGVWQYYSEPVLWSKWPYADVSVFTSFAFTRSSENLSTDIPIGGTKQNPIPTATEKADHTPHTGITWYDSIPAGNGDAWMTSRLFGDDVNVGWSSPRKLSDTPNFQVEYSDDYPWLTKPLLLSLNNYINDSDEGIDEAQWRADCLSNNLGNWSDSLTDATYMATCRRHNNVWSDWVVSKIKGENGAAGKGIVGQVSYFKAFNLSTGVTPPAENVDPTTDGWTTASNTINLSSSTPYLWAFTRVTYSDGTVYQSNAYIVRYYNDQAAVDYNQIKNEVVQAIQSDLDGLVNRLSAVEGNYANVNIDSDNSLVSIITNYKDADQKSFADIIADAAAAEININVGNAMGDTLTNVASRLSAAEGALTNAVTRTDLNGAINDVRIELNAVDNSIISTVSNNTFCLVNIETGDVIPYTGGPEPTGYRKKLVTNEMSAIKQDSHKISLLVKDDNTVAAGIQILSNCATNGAGTQIVLDANRVDISNLWANKINTGTSSGVNAEIKEGVVEIKNGAVPRARFGMYNGDIVLEFLDTDGETVLYNLGPSGFIQR